MFTCTLQPFIKANKPSIKFKTGQPPKTLINTHQYWISLKLIVLLLIMLNVCYYSYVNKSNFLQSFNNIVKKLMKKNNKLLIVYSAVIIIIRYYNLNKNTFDVLIVSRVLQIHGLCIWCIELVLLNILIVCPLCCVLHYHLSKTEFVRSYPCVRHSLTHHDIAN